MASPQPLLPLLLLFLLLATPSLADTDPGDAAAMAAIARSITPIPSRWSTDPSQDPCGGAWRGVSCASGRVISIDLQGTALRGSVPPEVANLSALQTLALQKNQLGGALPSLAGLAHLREVYLGQNAFKSIPATFFSGLAALVNVSLDHNPLAAWRLPGDLARCANLAYFSAMNATIVGELPDFFEGLFGLQYLRLSYNHLAGVLPPSLGGSGIRELYLNNQLPDGDSAAGQLSGSLDVIKSMAQLSVLWAHSNSFSGPLPDLSNCTALVDLQLRDNQLTGVLPLSLASLPNLKSLSVSNNLLQGPFPSLGGGVEVEATPGNSFCNPQPGPCDQRVTYLLMVAQGFGYPASLAKVWKGNNPCSGWLFVTCDPQGNITTLSLGSQKLVGTISDSIANFGALKVLRLQNNSLTGPIPVSLTRLTQLQVVDVSNNNLTGDVPAFGPNVKVITEGNPLLGGHTDPGNSGSTPSGSAPDAGQSKGLHSPRTIYALLIALCVLGMITGSAYFCYKRYKNRLKRFGKAGTQNPLKMPGLFKLGMVGVKGNGGSASKFHAQRSGEHGVAHLIETENMYVPIEDLRRATNNFSEGSILGRGGFGIVYKGERPDGTLIAVKRMECGEMGMKGIGEFKAEIEVLKKVRHRHLVALLGYCEHGNEKLLVYEYMPQGTLSQHLFQDNGSAYPLLSWKQRLMIALDVARGLEYLHSLAQTSFIHRDLKPSNILLDNELRAKVSDFGLVKLAPDGKHSVATRLAGTFGYLAPEYAATGKVTTKVDVYAFGVVLMELITGRKAVGEEFPDGSLHLVSWLRRIRIKRDDIRKMVDARLDHDEDDINSISVVAELAIHCTGQEAHQRPDMGHAVSVLVPLVGQWKPSCSTEEDTYSLSYKESSPNSTSATAFDFSIPPWKHS